MNVVSNININMHRIDLIKSLAIFYLIIFSNYVLLLFTCYQQNIIKNNKLLQYILGFFLFYFLVGIFADTGDMEFIPPIQKLFLTIVYYLFFLITTRLDIKIMLLVLIFIFFIYFIEINKNYYINLNLKNKNKSEKQFYDNHRYWITFDYPFKIRLFPFKANQIIYLDFIENISYFLIIFLVIIGIIAYIGEIKYQIGINKKNISWWNLLEDSKICNLSDRQSFFTYLKIGVGAL